MIELYYCILLNSGRASAAPVMDLFVTLLSLGAEGFKDLLIERKVSKLHGAPTLRNNH